MITYVTGLSGCGKSYYVNNEQLHNRLTGEIIPLDYFICYLMNREKYRDLIKSETLIYYLENVIPKKEHYCIDWKYDSDHYYDSFIAWLEKQEKDYIVEGIQVYNGMISVEQLVGNRIIVIKRSIVMCSIFRIIRALSEEKGLRNKIKRIKYNGLIHKYHIEEKNKLQSFIKNNEKRLNIEFIR